MNKIEFRKFPSITEFETLDMKHRFTEDVKNKDIFYSTEKIDGTNIQIAIAKDEVRVGKYTTFVEDEYPYSHVLKLKDVQKSVRNIQHKMNDDMIIRLYGEAYGLDIQGNKYNVKNEHGFNVKIFNVFVELPNQDTHYCLGREDMEKLVPNSLLLRVLHKGTLMDLGKTLNENSDFFNDVKTKTIKEGDVYARWETYELTLNSERRFINFLSVKNKNESFKEVKNIYKQIPEAELKQIEGLKENILRYVTENRLRNIISKGDLKLKRENIGQLVVSMQNDIRKEYREPIEDQAFFDKVLNKHCSKEIAALIINSIPEN